MAAELQTGLPIYRPHETFAQGGPSTQRRSPAVRHNFQHDVESFFWSLLWVSLTRIPGQATANVLFQTNDWKFLNTRIQVIMNQSGILHNTLQSLRSDVREDLFKTLRTLRWVLKAGYDDRKHAFEAMETYALVYGFFRQELTMLARNSLKSQVPDGVHLERLHIATSQKRARPGSSSEEDRDDLNETRPDKRRLRRC
ncbi:hypothetical protein C2E23DRAFT_464436 [Lenzites betulinus]|nr:hypothetical protein C2E23DRAFT_464436 [Lenzites betulinus]